MTLFLTFSPSPGSCLSFLFARMGPFVVVFSNDMHSNFGCAFFWDGFTLIFSPGKWISSHWAFSLEYWADLNLSRLVCLDVRLQNYTNRLARTTIGFCITIALKMRCQLLQSFAIHCSFECLILHSCSASGINPSGGLSAGN